jgi:glutaminyl-tRNA synthetase
MVHTDRTENRPAATPDSPGAGQDFIRAIVAEDLEAGRHREIVTRFPPEPNGYLHIGHAKSISLNFGIAAETGGRCHLRFDDTNPETEDIHYVESILDTVGWLGFDWGEHLYFASDYFEQMYYFAEHLIREGKAYVDSQDGEQIREMRGTVTRPGSPSPYRDRSVAENLDLFQRMRAGEFGDGEHVLRGRIDMSSPNMLLRDPVLYRIRHAHHYRTGDHWCIYPLYDFAHPIEDALESVTHSICTLEFENNRPLYDWIVENLPREGEHAIPSGSMPRQYEFARGNLDYTVMSKRKLLELVKAGLVGGWDDPRMPTLAGLRRRGVTPAAIRSFWERMGVARTESRVDLGKLEYAIRDDLNQTAPRVLCVLRPLRVVLTNYPDDRIEELEAPYFPHDVPKEGSRRLPFSGTLFIDREDFMEEPSKGFFRLAPGREVRLRYGYVIRCEEVIRDAEGEVVELRCTYDPDTRGGNTPDGRVVRGTIQWVSAEHAVRCEVRLYDRLFTVPDPDAGTADFKVHLNPESLVVVRDAMIEPSVLRDGAGTHYQFERMGYFYGDPIDYTAEMPVFNRTVTLRDTWSRTQPGEKTADAGKTKKGTKREKSGRSGAASESSPPAGWGAEGSSQPSARTPELDAKRERFERAFELQPEEAEILSRTDTIASLFEATVELGGRPRAVATSLVNDLLPELKALGATELAFTPSQLLKALELVEDGTISSSSGKVVMAELARSGADPASIVEAKGLRQQSDPALIAPLVDSVISANPQKVAEYRGGRDALIGFFIGQVMRQSGGRANPELVRQLLEERLGSS